jgi:hypothetical protein
MQALVSEPFQVGLERIMAGRPLKASSRSNQTEVPGEENHDLRTGPSKGAEDLLILPILGIVVKAFHMLTLVGATGCCAKAMLNPEP